MKKTVWIVDDDHGILDVIKIILEQEGYNAVVISEPMDIFGKIKQDSLPDVILLDVLMSGIDGRDVGKQLKQNPKTQHIPIIIMTADIQIENKAKDAMADAYIKKPFDIDDLLAIVKKNIH
jgi:CheY-like chemotaxis protein